MQIPPSGNINPDPVLHGDLNLQRVVSRLSRNLERDYLVEQTIYDLQRELAVDRVLLYYFYRQWKGQITFEALSAPHFSVLGSTGPDECFNDTYAAMYLAGRVRAISDIETEPIAECHRDFLRSLQVRANLVVPVLTPQGLWGLLVAHHCQSTRPWSNLDITRMQQKAAMLATSSSICSS